MEGSLSGVVEACASKFLSKVGAADVDADDGKLENVVDVVARMRSLYRAGFEHSDVELIKTGCRHCFAIFSPWEVDYNVLSAAMQCAVSDKPGPYLKPLLNGPASQAILAKSVAVLEKLVGVLLRLVRVFFVGLGGGLFSNAA